MIMRDAIDALPERQRRLLTRLLIERRARAVRIAPAAGDESSRRVPLSFAQERLWFLHRLDPDSPAYNAKYTCRLRGPLHVATLEAAINAIVARHAVLRTTFPMENGRAVAVVQSIVSVPLGVIDLTSMPGQRQAEERHAIARRESRRPFDLSRAPLVRVLLLRIGPNDHQLVLAAHHVVADAWALAIFLDELGIAYRALRVRREPAWPPLALQYADYARWQREQLEHGALDPQRAYWQRQLDGDLQPVALPMDYAKPAVARDAGGVHCFELGPELSGRVHRMAISAGVTLYMVLLAAYELVLHWLSGQTDFAIACPIANRHRTETEGLIGFFTNTLVMRARIEDGLTCGELLDRVRDTALGAYSHQDVPFEWVVQQLQPVRTLDSNPVCRVLFVLQNVPDGSLRLDDVTVETLPLETHTTRFDVELIVAEQAGAVSGRFVYSMALFTPSTAARMVQAYLMALSELAADPARTVSDIKRSLQSEQIARTRAAGEELQRLALTTLTTALHSGS